jgi:hypothetical protein
MGGILYLLSIKIKVLMGDHIAKTHGSFPVNLWKGLRQQAWLQFFQPFKGFTGREELHADHIEEVLPVLGLKQRCSGEQRFGLALDAFERLAQGCDH